MAASSKFGQLRSIREAVAAEDDSAAAAAELPIAEPALLMRDEKTPRVETKTVGSSRVPSPTLPASEGDGRRARGRPRSVEGGKEERADYTQVSAYIPAEMHLDVKIAILQRRKGNAGAPKDFSALVEHLLDGWLRGK